MAIFKNKMQISLICFPKNLSVYYDESPQHEKFSFFNNSK